MAVIDATGRIGTAPAARARKSLHPSCYLAGGLIALLGVALLLDTAVGLIG